MKKIIKIICLFIFLMNSLSADAQLPFDGKQEIVVPFDTNCVLQEKVDSFAIKYEFGIDISHYQGIINWDSLKTDSVQFVIMKASEGVDLLDNKFQRNWKEAERVGITRGAYHFFRPHLSGRMQAELFLKTVQFDSGDFHPVIDVEKVRAYSKCARKTYLKNFNDFMNYVHEKTGVMPIVYTTANFWNYYYGPYVEEHKYHLWIASYRNPRTQIPHFVVGFYSNEWTLWQYTNTHKVKGINGLVDANLLKKELKDQILFK